MILKQYYLSCLSQASYLLGDETTKTAIIVDPRRDIEQYVQEAAELGLRIGHVILTHFHADFVAGHLELRDRVGARIYLGARAQADYAFQPLRDGDVLEFGDLRLTILETPGHTPEAISIVVYDLANDARRPHAVLTGDTLFIGDVGRPDLMASIGISADALAELLYESLHGKLLRLPDETLVYPAHGAGSMCGKSLSAETVSTLGAQRRVNYALQPMARDEFVRMVTADQPEAPAYFAYDAALNRRERPTLEQVLAQELTALSLEAVLRAVRDGAQLLDARDPAEFAAGHLVGSLNIGLGGRYATWAGILLTPDRPIVLVASPGTETSAAVRLGRVGLDTVLGYLAGGVEAVKDRPELLRRTERVTSPELPGLLAARSATIVDVRFPGEWRQGAIPGSINIPLNELPRRAGEIPTDRPALVYCQTGQRSSTAASLLAQAGRTDIVDLIGGITAWKLFTEREEAKVHA
jgi:glyoxylase-like metal-dependent hydrolase (beta-lactamase superfamily II)/rhodanese-related sulfurtransferase